MARQAPRRRGAQRRGAGRIAAPAPPAGALPVRHALALGALQGPTELVPVSSSGHLVLLPVLLEWPYARLEPELRKTFEVALHAGTAVALLVALRHEVADVVRDLDSRGALGAVLTFAPAALAGLALEEAIERQAGTPLAVAAAQVLAGIGLAVADRRPDARPYADAGTLDHLAIGLAQAAALVPGVSRNGATLTAARLRGLDRPAASRLSRHAALPAIVGAAALKGVRLVGRGVPAHLAVAFSTGAAAAFASTLASRGLLGRIERARSYLPLAAYRVALGAGAAVLLRRRRRAPSAGRQAGRVPAPVAPCASMAR